MIFLFFLTFFLNIFSSENISLINLETNKKENIFEKIYSDEIKKIYDSMQPGGETYEFLILMNDKINENFLTDKKEKIEKLMEFQIKIKDFIEKFEFTEKEEKFDSQLELLKFTYLIIETIKNSFIIFDKTIGINKLKETFDEKNFIKNELFKNLEVDFYTEKKIGIEDKKNITKKSKTLENFNEKLDINDLFKKNLNEEKTIEEINLIKKKSENFLSESLRYIENFYNSSINYIETLFKKNQSIKKEENHIDEEMKKLEETSFSTIKQYQESSKFLLELSENLKIN